MFPIRDELPAGKTPAATYGLIACNVLMFLWQLGVQSDLSQALTAEQLFQAKAQGFDPLEYLYFLWLREHGLVPALLMDAPISHLDDLLRGLFLHGGWLHLLGNIWFLYIFGDNVEARLGTSRYVTFYLGCGLAASAAQIAADPASQIPIIGASGAIAGVLGAYLVMFPRARVVTVIPIFIFLHVMRLPAYVFLVVWLVFQNVIPVSQSAADGVAYWAHIGGFVAGAGYILFSKKPMLSEAKGPAKFRSFDKDGFW